MSTGGHQQISIFHISGLVIHGGGGAKSIRGGPFKIYKATAPF